MSPKLPSLRSVLSHAWLLGGLIACLTGQVSAEVLSSPWYQLSIHPEARITERIDTGWETMLTAEWQGQRARVRWKSDGLVVLFGDATLRVQPDAAATATQYRIVTDFEGKRYTVSRNPREVAWDLPGHQVFFRTFGGKVTSAIGSQDFLQLTRDTKGGRLSLESQAGTTDALLRRGVLEVFDGPEVLDHDYFVRGLAFRRGPITLRFPLPSEPFLNALPPERFLLVESQSTPPSTVTEGLDVSYPVEEPTTRDPLDAPPADWKSPVYRANEGSRGEDPLNSRREIRPSNKERPLDAKTAPNSEELLKVQDLPLE